MTYVSEQFMEVLPSGDIFHYSPNRMFGPYTEILELTRIKYSNETQTSLSVDQRVQMGAPVLSGDHGFGGFTVAYLHPIDYVWLLIREPFLADKIAQYYIRWRIEQQALTADYRLSFMSGVFSAVKNPVVRFYGDSKIFGEGTD